ncbi:tRNA N(3)-methylcytidine methyltransferase METTL6 [Culicoides brevitarsis]|uniref:tRNA N(3)-methylcytidine methyltransferase METTL6 n=1 Tax=Culicoides brevitarsis TaxID=469753 RepID=UPI00307BBE3D
MAKQLTDDEKAKLEAQNARLVSDFQAVKLEKEAKKNWDLFYKRNTTKFFKDRHWSTREFQELLGENTHADKNSPGKLLEIGCGVGNLIFPLIEDKLTDYFIYCCDFSPRAIEIVKQNPLYSEDYMKAFPCDITTDEIFDTIEPESLDLITLIFVLSAIHPDKFDKVMENLRKLLKPGGMVLFRDYGLHDMAQLRFKPGSKIAEKLYVRQDGTRSYYFSTEETQEMYEKAGFSVVCNEYIHRRTINLKEGVDVPRIFVQGKYRKESGT